MYGGKYTVPEHQKVSVSLHVNPGKTIFVKLCDWVSNYILWKRFPYIFSCMQFKIVSINQAYTVAYGPFGPWFPLVALSSWKKDADRCLISKEFMLPRLTKETGLSFQASCCYELRIYIIYLFLYNIHVFDLLDAL